MLKYHTIRNQMDAEYPTVNIRGSNKPCDLYELYTRVKAHGGFRVLRQSLFGIIFHKAKQEQTYCEHKDPKTRSKTRTKTKSSNMTKQQCHTIQYNTIQYNTIQYNIQYNTIQYNTIQYNTRVNKNGKQTEQTKNKLHECKDTIQYIKSGLMGGIITEQEAAIYQQ